MNSHAQSPEELTAELDVDPAQGLTSQEATSRLEKHGRNELQHARRRPAWQILLDQFKSVVIIILALAGVGALLTAQWTEAGAIAAVVLVNTAIGFFTEYKAVRSMQALREMSDSGVRVRRDGEEREIDRAELVPGDIVLTEEGDLVAADLRLFESGGLRVNEAALTGESVPVDKTTAAVDAEAQLADRTCMLFKGTSISDGSATAVVVATGQETELGKIATLAEEAESESTPLQKRLDALGRKLAYITIGIAVLVALVGLAAGRDPMLMIETSIALGVAAIPEGLPIVATIALARGMWLMAKRNALVNRLTAVETLGATRVIFTDKTGTLTENRMTLQTVATADGEQTLSREQAGQTDEQVNPEANSPGEAGDTASALPALSARALRIGTLCNGATLAQGEQEDSGDPTEIALLRAGQQHGMPREQLLEQFPERRVVEFEPDTMMMATYHQSGDHVYVAVKGAPSAVLDACESWIDESETPQSLDEAQRKRWRDRTEELAQRGLRMLAVADKQCESTDAEPYEQLRLVGLVGLLDPPRREVKESINRCQAAGIRVVMVTGDQATTGRAIGEAVGIGDEESAHAMHGSELKPADEMDDSLRQRLFETSVFARVSPEQKLNLIKIYQARGEPVAMTGDGVNDAPALKKADIGVAMGKRGTDAAKQTADMILRDDAFSTIVKAVEQGRVIFGNIRKSVVFMLCTNVAEVLAVAVASVLGVPLPLRPLQILYLNVITDVFPALALGIGRGQEDVMQNPPRKPDEAVLTRHHWTALISWSVVIATCVMLALVIALQGLGFGTLRAVTVSFMTLGLGKLWFVFNLRDRGASRWNNDITRNGWLWGAIGLCLLLLAAAVHAPLLSDVLQTRPPGPWGWLTVLLLSVTPAVIGLFVPGIRFHGAARAETQDGEAPLDERLASLEDQLETNRELIESIEAEQGSS